MNINGNDTGLPDPSPGPTDDGYIAVAVKSVPQDPFCCAGPDEQEDGAHLHSALPFLCLLVLMAPRAGDCGAHKVTASALLGTLKAVHQVPLRQCVVALSEGIAA